MGSSDTQVAEIGDVPAHWHVGPLCDFTDRVTYGFTNPMPDSDEGPYKITAKDINHGRILYETARHTTQEAYDEKLTAKSRPKIGDVLLTKDGSIGRVAVCDRDDICINQSVAVIEINSSIDSRFLKYLLLSPYYQHAMANDADGTTIKHIYITRVDKMEVAVPPLPEQKAIAHILGTLDDKIELNRRMNATLEGMAQALFKSWFVDFDPVIDNALAAGNPIPDELAPHAEVRREALADGTANREAAKAFPASFYESEEMGWIPEGWEAESINTLISVIYGAPFKSSMFIPAGEGMPVIRIRDLKTGTPQNWTTEDHPKKTLIKTGDVVVGMDAEFRATIWPGENGYLNQRLFLARPKESSVNNFFVQHTLAPQLEFEENTQVGTTVSHLGKKELDKFTALNPGKELLFEYSKATTPLLERLVSNHVVLETLTKLRDTLLPKLISGELRLPEAENLFEEALA